MYVNRVKANIKTEIIQKIKDIWAIEVNRINKRLATKMQIYGDIVQNINRIIPGWKFPAAALSIAVIVTIAERINRKEPIYLSAVWFIYRMEKRLSCYNFDR